MVFKCDACEKDFDYSKETIEKMTEGEYEVQYLRCPHCGKKYHVLTIDSKMRALVNERRKIANKLRVFKYKMSKGIHVHQKAVTKLQKEDRRLKNEQMKMLSELKKIGTEILAKADQPEVVDEKVSETEA